MSEGSSTGNRGCRGLSVAESSTQSVCGYGKLYGATRVEGNMEPPSYQSDSERASKLIASPFDDPEYILEGFPATALRAASTAIPLGVSPDSPYP